MQFWSHCYTVVSYQALFRLSVYKIPAVYLSGAKIVCFCTIRDFGSPTILDFSLTVKAVTLIFISGYGSAISSAKEEKSGFIYNLVKS